MALVLATLAPTDRELPVGCTIVWSIPTLSAVELIANLLLCVPVALLGEILTRGPFRTLLAVSAASLLIEVVQAFVPLLGRSCSSNGWLYNTLGALLGAVLAAAALRLPRSTRPNEPAPQQ